MNKLSRVRPIRGITADVRCSDFLDRKSPMSDSDADVPPAQRLAQ